MRAGITPIIAVILLLLITIALVGVASVFFGRTVQQAAAAGGQQTQEMVEQAGVQFAIEAVNRNKVSLRNLGLASLQVSGLSFYVNNAKIDTDSPAIPPGETRLVTLNDAQLSVQPDPSELRVSAGGYSDRITANFYDTYTVGYWKFDEGSGTSAADSTGGNTGILGDGSCTPGSGSCPQWTSGQQGKALQFDGIDDYVQISRLVPIESMQSTSFTFEVRIKSTGDTESIQQVFEGHTTTGEIYLEGRLPGVLAFHIQDDAGVDRRMTTGQLDLNTEYHIVGTYNGAVQNLYVNSVAVAPLSWTGTFTIVPGGITIGRDHEASIQYFRGIIDEVRILNIARPMAIV